MRAIGIVKNAPGLADDPLFASILGGRANLLRAQVHSYVVGMGIVSGSAHSLSPVFFSVFLSVLASRYTHECIDARNGGALATTALSAC